MTDKIFYYSNGRCTPKEFKLDCSLKYRLFYLTINAYGDIWTETYKEWYEVTNTLINDWYFTMEDVNNLYLCKNDLD